MEGGSSRNKIAASVMAVFCALSILFAANIAEAAIGFQPTRVEVTRGKYSITGYYYNNGNSVSTATKIRFIGNIGQYIVDVVRPLGILVRVSPGGKIEATWTIPDARFKSINLNDTRWHLRATVTSK